MTNGPDKEAGRALGKSTMVRKMPQPVAAALKRMLSTLHKTKPKREQHRREAGAKAD